MKNISTLLPKDLVIYDFGKVSLNGECIGIVHPSAQFIEKDGRFFAYGKEGFRLVDLSSAFNAAKDLVAAGVVITGTNDEVTQSISILGSARYSRTASYILCLVDDLAAFIMAFSRIFESKVAIIGCGGIGSLVAYLLAGSGVGNLTLVDNDTIEESNFNRQMFWHFDVIGKDKVMVLKEELERRFKDGLIINVINKEITKEVIDSEVVGVCGSVVITADSPLGVHLEVIKNLEGVNVNILGGGYRFSELVFYDGGKWVNESLDDCIGEAGWKWFWHEKIAPSFGPINVEVAGLIANRLIQKIAGIENKLCDGFFHLTKSEVFPRTYLAAE